jgi:hypothetical protein
MSFMNIRFAHLVSRLGPLLLLLGVFASAAVAQSTDIAWPTPVRTIEVRGTIAARDIGDPRVTDHYYAFTGNPGDVLITVESENLNGDVDVFTYTGMRPLLKSTIYAGGASTITKSIYLRSQEVLMVRIEGRTPNDDPATYRLRFGGSFAPITTGPLAEHEDANQPEPTTASVGRGGRRVSSVGARIEEPPTEVAEAPTPVPTPEVVAPEPKAAPPKTTTRTVRPSRRPGVRGTRPPVKPKPVETAKSEPEEKPANETEKPAGEKNGDVTASAPPPPRRTRASRTPAKASTADTAPAPAPEQSGPRLIIETTDGSTIDRYMSTVRRVTVENGQVVVLGKDGKFQRIPLASVVRMTISQ